MKMRSPIERPISSVKSPRPVKRLDCIYDVMREPMRRPINVPINTVATLSSVPLRNMASRCGTQRSDRAVVDAARCMLG